MEEILPKKILLCSLPMRGEKASLYKPVVKCPPKKHFKSFKILDVRWPILE